jgi:FkbM family methyltransferase
MEAKPEIIELSNIKLYKGMYLLKLYFLKALKRFKLFSKFNFFFFISLNSTRIKIPFINGIGLSNFIIKEDWLDDIISVLIPNYGGCFIDVGANIGQSLIRVKTTRPDLKYIGFEPGATCVSYLQYLISMNNFQNCEINNCALSYKTQSLILEKSSKDDPRASVVPDLRPGFFTSQEKIMALDFDSHFHNEFITFVKIDVEGAELDVINGMRNSILIHKPVITCEVLDGLDDSVLAYTQTRVNELTKLIHGMDYSIVRLQTEKESQKLVSYELIDSIIIKQWTPESYNENDYIFYPKEKEVQFTEKLKSIVLA